MLEKIEDTILNENGSKKKNSHSLRKLGDLSLNSVKFKFTSDQLQNLNYIFQRKLNEERYNFEDGNNILKARSITECLIQRLLCGAGKLDSKFTSKYLINLHDSDDISTNMEYLIRLDNLSKRTLYSNDMPPELYVIENYPDFPKSYARIRIYSGLYNTWGEYADVQGYLRRDRIQTRYAELLSLVAGCEMPKSPMNIDESVLSASPGKVVDAYTLHNILKIPPEGHVYFCTSGSSPKFPEPKEFRLTIKDDVNGISIQVEFLSPELYPISIDVRILLGIETDSWPSSTNVPTRILLSHSDALLYQQAAQTGFYLVGYGVQSSAWQMRFPAAEEMILKNYSPTSVIRSIYKLGLIIIQDIFNRSEVHCRYPYAYKILNNYIFKTALLYALESDSANPSTVVINWSPQTLSTHVIKILDKLVIALREENFPNYFFPDANLLKNPGHLTKEDYLYEATSILVYLGNLAAVSNGVYNDEEDYSKIFTEQNLEMLMLYKWKLVMDSSIPICMKKKRLRLPISMDTWETMYTLYTTRQLEFLSLLFKNALNVRKNTLEPLVESCGELVPHKPILMESTVTKDLILIVLAILEEAKVYYLSKKPSYKARQKLAEEYDTLVLNLTDLIRKANESNNDRLDFVKLILKWLYRTLELNRRLLTPIMKPYMDKLFISSHENSWFLEDIKKRMNIDEQLSLSAFASVVNENKITPGGAFMDSINKNCKWASEMLKIIEEDQVRVIFIKGRGKINRHIMSVSEIVASEDMTDAESVKEYFSIPNYSYFYKLFNKVPYVRKYRNTRHAVLRDNSPLTKLFNNWHRNGEHRCAGDIARCIISMQKLNIFNEISSILPVNDRQQLLELIQKYVNDLNLPPSKSSSNLSLRTSTVTSEYCLENNQKYSPKEENGKRIKEQNLHNRKTELKMGSIEFNRDLLTPAYFDDRIRRASYTSEFQARSECSMRSRDSIISF